MTPPAVVLANTSSAECSSAGSTLRHEKGDAILLAELGHRAPRDALQDVGIGRRDGAVLHHEDIVARPLGERAIGTHQQRIVAATVVGLETGLYEVGPIVVLVAGVDRLR